MNRGALPYYTLYTHVWDQIQTVVEVPGGWPGDVHEVVISPEGQSWLQIASSHGQLARVRPELLSDSKLKGIILREAQVRCPAST